MSREFTIYKLRKERDISLFPFEGYMTDETELCVAAVKRPCNVYIYSNKMEEIRRGSVDDFVEIKLEDFDEEFIEDLENEGWEIKISLMNMNFDTHKLVCNNTLGGIINGRVI